MSTGLCDAGWRVEHAGLCTWVSRVQVVLKQSINEQPGLSYRRRRRRSSSRSSSSSCSSGGSNSRAA